MAGFSAGHCKAFFARAAELAAIQFRVTQGNHLPSDTAATTANPNISATLKCGKLDLIR